MTPRLLLLAADADAGRALGRVAGRWFDPASGSLRPGAFPVEAPRRSWPWLEWIANLLGRGSGTGNVLPILGLVVALVALVGVLVWFWREYRPDPAERGPGREATPGRAASIEELPEALRGGDDPRADAARARDRGDRREAVIRLFAHQLLTLSRLGLVRLAPGRTGRQLVRAVADREFRGLAGVTLRSFEAAFYGHRDPSDAEFAAVWDAADRFDRRAAAPPAGVAS